MLEGVEAVLKGIERHARASTDRSLPADPELPEHFRLDAAHQPALADSLEKRDEGAPSVLALLPGIEPTRVVVVDRVLHEVVC
jgi:hypothetical protein